MSHRGGAREYIPPGGGGGSARSTPSRTASHTSRVTPRRGVSPRQSHGGSTQQYQQQHSNNNNHLSPRVGSNSRQNSARYSTGTPIHSSRSLESTGSTGYGDLEDVLQDVVGIRMTSLNDLRRKIEELSSLQAEEEKTFKDAMQLVFDQASSAKEMQKEAEEEYEDRLVREKNERQKAIELMQNFKKEGSGVMAQMKDSLRTVQAKYHAELEKNAKLTAQLRKMEEQHRRGGGGGSGSVVTAGSREEAAHLQTQVDALSQLLEEEDSVIMELRQRNRGLENKVRVLTDQREKLLDVDHHRGEGAGGDSAWVVGETLDMGGSGGGNNDEYYDLLNSIKAMDRGAYATSANGTMSVRKSQEMIEKLKRFSLILMQRLKAEQRQRLKVEEQAAKMAAAQDDLISKYENRQSSVAGAGGSTPSHAPSGASSAVRFESRDRSSISQSPSLAPSSSTTASGGFYGAGSVGGARNNAPQLQGQQQRNTAAGRNSGGGSAGAGGRLSGGGMSNASSTARSNSVASSSHHSAVSNNSSTNHQHPQPADLPSEPQQQAIVGLETIEMASEDGGGDQQQLGTRESTPVNSNYNNNNAAPLNGNISRGASESSPTGERNEPSTAAPPSETVPSLEEQLEAVSTDFELSLQQWSDAIGGGSSGGAGAKATSVSGGSKAADMEQHFLPDEE